MGAVRHYPAPTRRQRIARTIAAALDAAAFPVGLGACAVGIVAAIVSALTA